MTAHCSPPAVACGPSFERSIDDLDGEICPLARQMNAETYRFLLLVRDFDDRFGLAKWSLRNCAEWLAWRCGMSLSTAREKVRTAHALRALPAISAAFADGRLSYSKVRALTRVADAHDEDLLLAYALDATASQVEERCRQMRNVAPESTDAARRLGAALAHRLPRPRARHDAITVELPIEDGEVIAQRSTMRSPTERWQSASSSRRARSARRTAGARNRPMRWSRSRRRISRAAGDESREAMRGARRRRSSRSLPSRRARRRVSPPRRDRPRGSADRDRQAPHLRRQPDHGRRGRARHAARRRAQAAHVSTPLKRALWSRDRGCTFPGCHNTRFVDAHHVHHWADGGDTSLENLTLLCTHHHRLLHEGGFTIRARSARRDLLPAPGRAGDSAWRLSRRGHARRRCRPMARGMHGIAAKIPPRRD